MRRCSTTLEGEMTAEEHSFLLDLISRECFQDRHLEVGTAAGGTLWRMMRCFEDEHRPQFVVVDRMTYFASQFDTVRANLRKNGLEPHDVDFRITTSRRAYQQSSKDGETFDFILIDASHKMPAVTADLRWTRLLNVGGILCLHDYSPRFPGVQLSVDRFLAHHPNYEVVGQAESLLALQKERPSLHAEVTTFDRTYSVIRHVTLEAQRKLRRWKRGERQAA